MDLTLVREDRVELILLKKDLTQTLTDGREVEVGLGHDQSGAPVGQLRSGQLHNFSFRGFLQLAILDLVRHLMLTLFFDGSGYLKQRRESTKCHSRVRD